MKHEKVVLREPQGLRTSVCLKLFDPVCDKVLDLMDYGTGFLLSS